MFLKLFFHSYLFSFFYGLFVLYSLSGTPVNQILDHMASPWNLVFSLFPYYVIMLDFWRKFLNSTFWLFELFNFFCQLSFQRTWIVVSEYIYAYVYAHTHIHTCARTHVPIHIQWSQHLSLNPLDINYSSCIVFFSWKWVPCFLYVLLFLVSFDLYIHIRVVFQVFADYM